jgi:hypothetical protein
MLRHLGEYLDTLDTKNLDPITWVPAGKWNKLHNDGKSTTGGEFRSYSMSGSDGMHRVKIVSNGLGVISVIVKSPYSGEKVKEALRHEYNAVRQVYVLSRGLSFIKNIDVFYRRLGVILVLLLFVILNMLTTVFNSRTFMIIIMSYESYL